jgi:hypothetical protein
MLIFLIRNNFNLKALVMDVKNRIKKIPTNNRTNKYKLLKIALISLVILFILGQLFFDYSVYWGMYDSKAKGQYLSSTLIFSAIQNLLKPANVDPKTGDVYLTDAKLVLPPFKGLDSILYNYSSSAIGPEQLQLTTNQTLTSAENKLLIAEGEQYRSQFWNWNSSTYNKNINAVFAQVPNLQACTNAIHLQYSQNTQNSIGSGTLVSEGSKKLANGRTIYFFQNTGCNFPAISINSLMNYVKQIQSY